MAVQPIITRSQGTAAHPPAEHHINILLAPSGQKDWWPTPPGYRRVLEAMKRHLVSVLFGHLPPEDDSQALLKNINWQLAQPDQHRPALTLGDVLHPQRRRVALRRTQTLFYGKRVS